MYVKYENYMHVRIVQYHVGGFMAFKLVKTTLLDHTDLITLFGLTTNYIHFYIYVNFQAYGP